MAKRGLIRLLFDIHCAYNVVLENICFVLKSFAALTPKHLWAFDIVEARRQYRNK